MNEWNPDDPEQPPVPPVPRPGQTAAPAPSPNGGGPNTGFWGGMVHAGAAMASPPPPPGQPFDRTAFRDSWMGSSGSPDAFLAAHPEFSGVQRIDAGKGDKFALPSGEIMDLQIAKGLNGDNAQHGWTGVGEVHNGQATYYPPSGPGAAGGGPGSSGGSPFQDQIRQQLMQILQNSQKPVDASDPQIASQMTASKVLADRMAQQQRAASAERAAANGTLNGGQSSGAFDTELNGIQENEGQQLMGLQASLFGRVAQQKQAQLQQALSLAVQSGDAESARAIQMQIAQMDNQIRQQQLAQQGSQFNDQYGLSVSDRQYERDRDAARAKAGLPF